MPLYTCPMEAAATGVFDNVLYSGFADGSPFHVASPSTIGPSYFSSFRICA